MTSPHRFLLAAAVLWTGGLSTLCAQTTPEQETVPQRIVPLHEHHDDPTFGSYGVWAAGHDYKARFAADGVEIVPFLGRSAPRNLTLRWTTQDVTLGDRSLTAEQPAHGRIATPTRYEVARGPVVEAWDLRAGDLEQTFTIARRPSGAGDLVVRGTLDGGDMLFAATERAAGHMDLAFHDERGTETLRYGAAFLVDATGTKRPLTTRFRDGDVELVVPQAMLAEAVFPITIDPIVDVRLVRSTTGPDLVAVAVSPASGVRLYVVLTQVSASDIDLAVFSTTSSPFSLFADISAAYDTVTPDIAYAGGSQRFVVGWARQGTDPLTPTLSNQSRIRFALINDPGLPGIGPATLLTPPTFSTIFLGISQDWKPSISGAAGSGVTVAVAAESQDNSFFNQFFSTPRVRGIWLNTNTGAVSHGPFDIAPQPAGNPDTLPVRDDGENQFVYTYDYLTNGNTTWRIAMRSQSFSQTFGPEHVIASKSVTQGTVRRPQIAGGDGEYCITYNDRIVAGVGQLQVARFRMPQGSIYQGLRFESYPGVECDSLDFDANSGSHWVAGICDEANGVIAALRLGWDGNETDRVTRSTGPIGSPEPGIRIAVDPTDPDGRFVMSYAYSSFLPNQTGRFVADYVYPATDVVQIASSCGSGFLTTVGNPSRGNRNFRLGIANIGANRPATPLVSLLPQNPPLSLDFIGLIGCELGVDLNVLVGFPSIVSNGIGTGSISIPIPEPLDFDFYAQWIYVDPSVTGLLRLTDAARLEVR
jgi:hypothetical protein